MDPFVVDGPAVISFSGGRTSGYMLRRILDEGLRPDVHVLFANTGKERAETLDFVRDVAVHWQVPIHWIEYAAPVGYDQPTTRGVAAFHEVSYRTASRQGEPFRSLIGRFLPNPVQRFCTQELKIRPMRDWMLAHGFTHWTNVVGIRADEPRRVARMREAEERRSERWDIALPLADAAVTVTDVNAFWSDQPFDLMLRPHEGNCDLCFLKGSAKIRNLVRDRPDLAEWWAQQEERTGATFRKDRASYRAMLMQPDLFTDGMEDTLTECFCHD
jgi:3'-phosphoadenosine 5'-phosphosulfate sulfotransferase (PAPS reductase)/FAD synthetase